MSMTRVALRGARVRGPTLEVPPPQVPMRSRAGRFVEHPAREAMTSAEAELDGRSFQVGLDGAFTQREPPGDGGHRVAGQQRRACLAPCMPRSRASTA
ncbi:hypothetical protein [Burkholderia ubonensis]|uniref:hypothetical protein n=1 Tax=Burkholderia ubonensis TaxID=101571 RepID=UPI000A591EEF|nr:hypothetical protein [Burkholderia ubonensis]